VNALIVLACLAQTDEVTNARAVLADVVFTARVNQRSAVPLKDDELTDLLVRAAARSAVRLPEKQRAGSFLLAIGIGLDRSSLMRSNPLVGSTWKAIESDRERQARLAVLGEPTLFGRHDMAQHFAVSAALAALLGPKPAEAAGITKEWLDSQPGGSGFSFADLAADFGGVMLAEAVRKDPTRLKAIGRLTDHALPPKGLPEGMSVEAFENRYGGLKGRRFTEACDDLKKRLRDRPGFRK
jgi:hypothetical protein